MTARKHADYVYVYCDKHDSVRVRVHRRLNGRWDYDVFYPSGKIATYSDTAGDDFATKRDAVAEANSQHSPLHAIAVEGNVVDAAWYRRVSKSTSAHSLMRKKTPSPLDRAEADEEGVFFLTDVHERALGPAFEFTTRLAAKRAALKLVREGAHPRVEVWHRWRGDRYMQGLASKEGWSDV